MHYRQVSSYLIIRVLQWLFARLGKNRGIEDKMSDQHNQDLAGLVEETIRTLYDKGIAAADLAPLVKLHNAVKAPNAPSAAPCCASHSLDAGNSCRAPRNVQPYWPL